MILADCAAIPFIKLRSKYDTSDRMFESTSLIAPITIGSAIIENIYTISLTKKLNKGHTLTAWLLGRVGHLDRIVARYLEGLFRDFLCLLVGFFDEFFDQF